MSSPLLEASGINVAYGQLQVVFDVDVHVNPGETVILVGRNGAGKTTLFRTLSGFLKQTGGEVRFHGVPIEKKAPYEVAQMGIKYIHQDKQVFADLTVRESLELSSFATGDKNWEPVFGYFPKLKTLLDRKSGNLSGGERQMLLMAMALIGDPELVLMDEPTEGLAPHIINDLKKVFRDVARKTTLFIVEQNLPLVAGIADRVYCMKEGKIVYETASKAEIGDLAFEKYL
jgi:ABC-type branched-subunit amino acid transport system ATPase component